MRKFLIDTDTASDDAVAILMALREPDVRVEAITIVAGNCPIDVCIDNALNTIEMAESYHPPVYAGCSKPMLRDLYTAEFVHGDDGMGNMNLPRPKLKIEGTHAVDKLISLAERYEGELEVIALGPLTNLALAVLKEPRLEKWIKCLYIMGGAGLGPGNITPVAEFNFFVDPEAAQIVLRSNITKTVVGWDVCMGKTFINRDDIAHLNSLGTIGKFAVRCNATLIEFNRKWDKDGFDLPDPTTVAAALYPTIIRSQRDVYGYVEYQSSLARGQFVIDTLSLSGKPNNVTIVTEIDAAKFKSKLFQLLSSPVKQV